MATVKKIVDLVMIRISGGVLTTDIPVLPVDIKAYIPEAVNSIMGATVTAEAAVDPILPNPLFYQVFEDLPVTVNARNLASVSFEKRPLTTLSGRGVISVGEMGGRDFTRIQHDSGTLGAFYWKTLTGSPSWDIEGSEVIIYNLPVSVGEVYIKQIVHIDDYSWDDEILLPSGEENSLVDYLASKAMEQRGTPKDLSINEREDQQ